MSTCRIHGIYFILKFIQRYIFNTIRAIYFCDLFIQFLVHIAVESNRLTSIQALHT
jgi:hypothetical protein